MRLALIYSVLIGIVRGANEAERLLYIITPLKIDEMKGVNAIMKGNVILPIEGYLKQVCLKLHC